MRHFNDLHDILGGPPGCPECAKESGTKDAHVHHKRVPKR